MRRRRAGLAGLAAIVSVVAAAGYGSAHGATEVQPTRGSLLYETHDPARPLAELPLERTDVRVRILGYVARVEVRQTFNNPFKKPLEAIYVFPMPDNAGVGEMFIKVGEQRIRGVVESRDKARKRYDAAKKQGRISALLDQERPNIFTQAVANIEPGKDVLVHIRYDVPLRYDAGTYEFVYPMVVGPRYIPGRGRGTKVGRGRAEDTDEVPDASRITPPVRKPGSRAGHDVTLDCTVDPGTKIEKLWSPTHKVAVTRARKLGDHAFKVSLPPGERIPNKDFVVRYRLAGKRPAPSVVAQREGGDGYFALTIHPPAKAERELIAPRDVVFVIDSSARMAGEPMSLVKRAMRVALKHLEPDDRFRLVRFDGTARALTTEALAPTPRNKRRALSWINAIHAAGPTRMVEGLRAGFAGKAPAGRLRVVVLLSNAYVGNERAILAEIRKHVDASTRLYALGTGASTNRYLLERAARVGRGVADVVLLADRPEPAVGRFFDRIRAPILTDVSIDWRGMAVSDVLPAQLPDLFEGQPLSVVGRFASAGKGTIVVKGRLAGEPVRYRARVGIRPHERGFSGAESHGPSSRAAGVVQGAIARLWARARIGELELDHGGAGRALETAVTSLGMRHSLVTRYTSFVAVGEKVVDDNGARRTFVVPVEMPEGVSYESVFRTDPRDTRTSTRPDPNRHEVETGGDGDGGGTVGGSTKGPADRDYDNDDTEAAPAATADSVRQTSGGSVMFERIAVAGHRRWLIGAGVGLGFATAGDDQGAVSGLDFHVGRVVAPYWVIGTELGVRVPLFETDAAVWSSALLQLRYAKLLRGRLHLLGGIGGALVSGGELGLSYMGALELQLPVPSRVGAGLQLRLDGAAVGDTADPRSYSVGVRFSF